MGLNREWHHLHKMPANPTDEQRAKWHLEHLQNCDCRKTTPAIRKLIESFQQKVGATSINPG
jgi:hypothetical protein